MNKGILTILAAAMAAEAGAQFCSNYLEIYCNGGVQTLLYSPSKTDIEKTPGIGGGFGLGYKHYFNDYVGIGTGLGMNFYNSYGKCHFTDNDSEYGDETVSTTYDGVVESQKFAQLQIPIGVYYQMELNYHLTFTAGLGAKVGFPVKATYEVTEGSIRQETHRKNDYALLHQESHDDFMGDYDRKGVTGSFFLDAGLNKWFDNGVGLYIGLFFEYTFSDVLKMYNNQDIIDRNGVYNGVLASQHVTDVNLMCAGLKLGVNIPMQKKKKKEDLPSNLQLEVEEPMMDPVVRDSIVHLPDSLIYVRYSREEVRKVKHLIADMPEVEAVDEAKKTKFRGVIEAYDTLTAFEKLDITWTERGKIKKADYALNGEARLVELCKEMSGSIQFPFKGSGFTSDKTLEQQFEDLSFLLKLLPDAEIEIHGHADNQEVEHDPSIGKERALFVREVLMKKKVGGDQLRARDDANRNPVVPMTDEASSAKNRTITFKPNM